MVVISLLLLGVGWPGPVISNIYTLVSIPYFCTKYEKRDLPVEDVRKKLNSNKKYSFSYFNISEQPNMSIALNHQNNGYASGASENDVMVQHITESDQCVRLVL